MKEANWWQNYFNNVWLLVQQQTRSQLQTKTEVNFIDYLAFFNKYKNILDVPCGYGRIAIELAKKKYTVTGLDFSEANIAIAKRNLPKTKNKQVEFIQHDMRNLAYNNRFDMVICIYNSFGYFTDNENYNFLKGVYNSLQKNGGFLLETHVLETFLPVYTPQTIWELANQQLLVEQRNFDVLNGISFGEWTLIDKRNNKIIFDKSRLRIYAFKELINILEKIGFKDFEYFSNYEKEPFEFGADNLLIFMKK